MNFYFLIFIIGVICSQKISLGGEVFIGEIISFLIVLLSINKLYIPKLMKTMLVLVAIWIISQIISDIINNTEIIKAIKGVGAPLFLIVTLLACSTYFKNRNELIPSFFLGTTIGLWLCFLIGGEYYSFNPWKWGLGTAIGLSLLIYFSYWYKGKNTVILLVSVLFLLVSLSQSSRSLGGMFFISVIAYFVLSKLSSNKKWIRLSQRKITTFNIIILMLFVVTALSSVLGILFTSEFFLQYLSDDNALKFSTQASSDLGFILGARSEIVISSEAFIEKPFFGHGSWAENYDYVYRYINLVDLMGSSTMDYKTAIYLVESGLIPSHSFLMGALVWGGVFAGLFWLFMLYKIIEGMIKNGHRLSLVQVYLSITTLWNILFSPFGASARWTTALALWMVFFTYTTRIKQTRDKF